jgi:lysozyme
MSRLSRTLRRHEGSVVKGGRHYPYKDSVGKLTTGYGRNITDKGFSEDEARLMLHNDIQEAANDARKFHWFDTLNDVRQEVVVNMIFNMGYSRFKKFRNTINYIEEGRFEQASKEMLDSLWADQVGARAQELSRMMASGVVDEYSG